MTLEEKQELLSKRAKGVAHDADQMVQLLTAHGEENWTGIYAAFAREIRKAQTDKQRRAAIGDIQSIYGGLGSRNDFYIQALGEAEQTRLSLSSAISSGTEKMLDIVET
jgi:hypothetical protein